MSDLVKLYNPANASALTPEQLAGLQKLTTEQIKELAKAYPNATMQRAYLLIIDSKKQENKQLPTLSSFENLYNLRIKNGMTSYVAYNFKGYKPKPATVVKGAKKKTEVLDLQDAELKSLPGFKTANVEIPPTEVVVKKIGRPKKEPKNSL